MGFKAQIPLKQTSENLISPLESHRRTAHTNRVAQVLVDMPSNSKWSLNSMLFSKGQASAKKIKQEPAQQPAPDPRIKSPDKFLESIKPPFIGAVGTPLDDLTKKYKDLKARHREDIESWMRYYKEVNEWKEFAIKSFNKLKTTNKRLMDENKILRDRVKILTSVLQNQEPQN